MPIWSLCAPGHAVPPLDVSLLTWRMDAGRGYHTAPGTRG